MQINQEDALLIDYAEVERLERLITSNLCADNSASMPAIKRCLPKSPYLRTSDDRITEYRWDKLLFSEKSPYQLVEIFATLDFGNCLVLDGFINLAESDLLYTHSLMCHGKQDYKVGMQMDSEGQQIYLFQQLIPYSNIKTCNLNLVVLTKLILELGQS